MKDSKYNVVKSFLNIEIYSNYLKKQKKIFRIDIFFFHFKQLLQNYFCAF